jgi:hypothetical protein
LGKKDFPRFSEGFGLARVGRGTGVDIGHQ